MESKSHFERPSVLNSLLPSSESARERIVQNPHQAMEDTFELLDQVGANVVVGGKSYNELMAYWWARIWLGSPDSYDSILPETYQLAEKLTKQFDESRLIIRFREQRWT